MSLQKQRAQGIPAGSVVRLASVTPRRMRAPQAAKYMGVSESTFLGRVKEGLYPPSCKEVGAVFWLRDDIDAYIDRQFGLDTANDATPVHEDPFAARFRKAS